MLSHPRINGGIHLDSAIESQQFRFHCQSTHRFRDYYDRMATCVHGATQ